MAQGTGRALFERQLAYYAAGDIEGLLANNYAENARLLMFDHQVQGRDQIREHFAGFNAMAGRVTPGAIAKFVEHGNAVLVEVSAETEKLGTVVFVDAFVLEDGKIAVQFSTVK